MIIIILDLPPPPYEAFGGNGYTSEPGLNLELSLLERNNKNC